ncbi:unnamed protein product [Caretta caretta]
METRARRPQLKKSLQITVNENTPPFPPSFDLGRHKLANHPPSPGFKGAARHSHSPVANPKEGKLGPICVFYTVPGGEGENFKFSIPNFPTITHNPAREDRSSGQVLKHPSLTTLHLLPPTHQTSEFH